ncbi:MAG: AAA family ATPase, partial [Planctomycetaceae bacterium]|nr:AAA family ATPase [Planctomycetaceae bacterium]
KHPEQQYIQIDTTNILFICGGTFVGLEDIIARRLGRKVIGFGNNSATHTEDVRRELLGEATVEDVMEFGLIPELLGRLPVVGPLAPLNEEALVQVLTEPRNALVKQYTKMFEMEECHLEFSEGALREIAKLARARQTGARGLRSIVEQVMFDLMFELPELERGSRFVVTEEMVRGEAPSLPKGDSQAA